MLHQPAKVETDLLKLDSESAIDRVGAVASDVEDHLSGPVLKNAAHGCGESRFVRPT
jgi:hypothetical protein